MVIVSGNVTYSSLIRQTHANIYNLINTRTNVPDPLKRSSKRKFVYQKDPSVQKLDFEGYPFIVVRPPSMALTDKSCDGSKRSFIWTIPIKVVTTNELINRKGKGAEDNDTITEDVINTLDNATNLYTMVGYGLSDLDYDVSDIDFIAEDNKSVFVRFVDVIIRGCRSVRA